MCKQKANLLFWRGDVAKVSIISVRGVLRASCCHAVAFLCRVMPVIICTRIVRSCLVHTFACSQCIESVVKRWTFGSDAWECLG